MVFSCRLRRGGCTVLVVWGRRGSTGSTPVLFKKGALGLIWWAGQIFGPKWTGFSFGFWIWIEIKQRVRFG